MAGVWGVDCWLGDYITYTAQVYIDYKILHMFIFAICTLLHAWFRFIERQCCALYPAGYPVQFFPLIQVF